MVQRRRFYEVHVRTFLDSNEDGIGDFNGLTEKLDYLQDLGITAIWVLPFYPSPLRDDGYDITDYRTINPAYGTMADFRRFLRQAHLRGIRVVTELVINHTSDQHPWFQRARTAPAGSNYRNYYVWSDDPSKYSEARIILEDFEPSNWTFDPVARATIGTVSSITSPISTSITPPSAEKYSPRGLLVRHGSRWPPFGCRAVPF